MRPIKFRGKRIDNGEWVEGDLIHGQTGHTYILNSPGDWIHVRNDSVGQLTGLQDKNGVDIFEGDIVLLDDTYEYQHVVSWYDDGWGYNELSDNNSTISPFTQLVRFEDNIKITGTIHDTPSEKGE